jgi:acyl dehydratase
MSQAGAGSTRAFESLEPGDEFPVKTIALDKTFVRAYACAIDMNFGRFTDDAAARAEGLPGQITPGNMTLALLARSLVEWLPGARLVRLGTTFRGLALTGATVKVIGTITEKDEAGRTGECDVWMESPEGDRWVIGTATLAFRP